MQCHFHLFLLTVALIPLITCVRGYEPQPPLITRAPNPHLARIKRQGGGGGEGADFIGYTYYFGDWYAQSCPSGSTVRTSSTYFACAPTDATSFNIATGCAESSVLLAPGTTYPCGLNVCYTMLILTDRGDRNAKSAFACNTGQSVLSFFLTTSTEESVLPSVTSTTRRTIPSATEILTIPTQSLFTSSPTDLLFPSSSSSFSSNNNAGPASSSKPKAWIAGPVIGGIAIIAIIAGLGFWIWRLKKREKDPVEMDAAVPVGEKGQNLGGYSPQQLDSKGLHEAAGSPVHGYGERVELEGGGGGR